jgi:spore maturation protein CgeB
MTEKVESGRERAPRSIRSLWLRVAALLVLSVAVPGCNKFKSKQLIREGNAYFKEQLYEDALKKYCMEGALPVHLPEGANPELHRPREQEKTIDVSFVGQCYGKRPETIRRLGEAGIRVEAFGYGWPGGPLSTEEMVRIYSRSRINLGFGGVEGHDEIYCLKGRDFEIPMSGGLYLTEYHPELETVYDLGKEIVTYRGFDELVVKIRHLLANPDEAETIRQAGFRRARKEHTWEMRFERVFTLMNLI